MKNMKIWSLAIMFILALTACEKNPNNQNDGPTPGPGSTEIVNEWAITSWNGAEPAFNVYIDFNEDGTFSMYQQFPHWLRISAQARQVLFILIARQPVMLESFTTETWIK
jgi:hypothetical protein